MNLEEIERKCVMYLRNVRDPLAPVASLLERLQKDETCAAITEHELLGFLRGHELFRVIDGPDESETTVILHERIPSQSEIRSLISQQLETITDALSKAMEETNLHGDPAARDKVCQVLERAQALQRKAEEDGL